jgi:hypothetical protein
MTPLAANSVRHSSTAQGRGAERTELALERFVFFCRRTILAASYAANSVWWKAGFLLTAQKPVSEELARPCQDQDQAVATQLNGFECFASAHKAAKIPATG